MQNQIYASLSMRSETECSCIWMIATAAKLAEDYCRQILHSSVCNIKRAANAALSSLVSL